MPERSRAEPRAGRDRVRDADAAEHRLERSTPAVERRRDERDLLGRCAGADQVQQLLTDELEHAADAGALEEANRRIELRRGRR